MTTEFLPEQTIRYKTYAKQTLVDGLTKVFSNHPDALLQRTKASIEYPKTEVDYPAVVVRMYERDIQNAGIGHSEQIHINGESDSVEVSANVPHGGAVSLQWNPVLNALGYKVYKGTASNQENQSFQTTNTSFTDDGTLGMAEAVPTVPTALLDPPQPIATVLPPGNLTPGTYFYRVTAIFPSEAIVVKHYFYHADIEFVIFALSAFDRDLVADSLVQTIAMGTLEAYTNNFFDRVYPKNDLYPDSQLHFININADQISGFGENQGQTPWGEEDELLYQTSYRVGVFGELYSLPPEISYALVRQIFLYPYIGGIDPVYDGAPPDPASPWISNVSNLGPPAS